MKLANIVILLVALVLVSGCVQEESPPADGAEVPPDGKEQVQPEEDVSKSQPPELKYKGIWLPTLTLQDSDHLASNVQKLKDLGVDTIFIQALPPLSGVWFENLGDTFPPELVERIEEIGPIEKELIIAIIQTAHRNGLKVGLTISNPPGMEEVDLEALNSKIVEYAKVAEEHDVELFAPMNEPGKILLKDTGRWRQAILPRIREVYHGDIVWKGAGVGLPDKTSIAKIAEQPPGDFAGYDYIGFSSMFIPKEVLTPEEQLHYTDRLTLEDYSQYVEDALDYELALAERDGCKGVIITEFGVYPKGSLSEEEIARTYEIVLEKGEGRVVGFIALDFLGGQLPGIPPIKEDIKAEEVIREWFTKM